MLHTALNNFYERTFLPPMAIFAVALISGIWVQSIINLSLIFLSVLIIVTGLCSIAAFIYQVKSRTFFILLTILVSLVGAWRLTQYIYKYENLLNQITNIPCTITAHVINTESVNVHRFTYCTTISTDHIKYPQTGITVDSDSHIIKLYTLKPIDLLVGDSIIIHSLTIKPQKKKTFAWYLMKEQLLATLFCTDLIYDIVERPVFSFQKFFFETRSNLFFNAKKVLSPTTFSLYSTLFLGKKVADEDPQNVINEFRQWGVAHLLARSGIHLSLIILLWSLFLCCLPLPFLLKQLIILIIALTYNALSWGSISFGRALYVFLCCRVSVLFKQRMHLLHTLALVCIFFLLKNPMHVFYLDFQLSFLLTASLIWLNETLCASRR